MQPFDACVAKSLKSKINRIVYSPFYNVDQLNFSSKRQKVSNLTVLTMVDSWSMVEPQILRNGFMTTGIYPFNSKKGNNSKYVTENSIVQTIFQPRRQIGYNISNKIYQAMTKE